ncbi:MAG: hypothetical protein EAZ36_04560, partial [Verrucomicrobia bacterium]
PCSTVRMMGAVVKVFVTEADTLKNFQVRPGAAYYSAPRPDAPVMGLAGNEDPAEFADIVGRYNKFSLNKPLVAYVLVPVTTVVALAPAPEPAVVVAAAPAPIAEWSESFPADTTATLREDIPARSPVASGQTSELGEPGLARTFFGTVASTRNPLRPRRPFDFQLLDEGGSRIAYLDVSRLMLTERVEAFLGRPVTLFGLAEPLGISGNEIVIRVETFKLQ